MPTDLAISVNDAASSGETQSLTMWGLVVFFVIIKIEFLVGHHFTPGKGGNFFFFNKAQAAWAAIVP
jgi:hypothetical protein